MCRENVHVSLPSARLEVACSQEALHNLHSGGNDMIAVSMYSMCLLFVSLTTYRELNAVICCRASTGHQCIAPRPRATHITAPSVRRRRARRGAHHPCTSPARTCRTSGSPAATGVVAATSSGATAVARVVR